MRTNLKIWLPLLALILLMSISQGQAQNLDVLLKAVDRLETGLKTMVEKETIARAKETAELREQLNELKEVGPSASTGTIDNTQLNKLALEMKTLRIDVNRLAAVRPAPAFEDAEIISLVNDIEFLKAEVLHLRDLAGDNRSKLASIDDDGFYVQSQENFDIRRLTERLTELNEQLEKTIAGQTQPESAVNAPSISHGKIGVSGYVHQYYTDGSEETSTFTTKKARLCVKGDINQYAQIKIEGDFANSPKLTDGYLTISPHQQWSFRLGQQKPSFGTDFLTSSTAMPFVDNSKAKSLGTSRDIGLSVSYRNKFNKDYSLKLTTGIFNGSGDNTTDVNNNKNFVARTEIGLAGMFIVAPNLYIGKTNEFDSLKENINTIGSSVAWSWKNESAEAEYIHSKVGDTKKNGWYVWGAHSIPIGSAFLQKIQLLARYEQYDPDMDTPDNRENLLTLGTNLFIDKKYTKIQMNYRLISMEGDSDDTNEFRVNCQVAF